jgi:organic radical activating enzyme
MPVVLQCFAVFPVAIYGLAGKKIAHQRSVSFVIRISSALTVLVAVNLNLHKIWLQRLMPCGQLHTASKYVVFTGGEPLLQLDANLIAAMHAVGFEIAIETNGTLPVPEGVDWVCVSPKMGSELVVRKGNEIKVVIPQIGQDMATYANLDFEHYFVQAMDGPLRDDNLRRAIDFCKQHPQWKLSLQTHKLLQIP